MGCQADPVPGDPLSQDIPPKPIRGKWRIWGSGDLVHWYNLDSSRPGKDTGIEIDAGGRVRPCITPDDVDTVTRIITEHIAP
jgi:hypothetical protein